MTHCCVHSTAVCSPCATESALPTLLLLFPPYTRAPFGSHLLLHMLSLSFVFSLFFSVEICVHTNCPSCRECTAAHNKAHSKLRGTSALPPVGRQSASVGGEEDLTEKPFFAHTRTTRRFLSQPRASHRHRTRTRLSLPAKDCARSAAWPAPLEPRGAPLLCGSHWPSAR